MPEISQRQFTDILSRCQGDGEGLPDKLKKYLIDQLANELFQVNDKLDCKGMFKLSNEKLEIMNEDPKTRIWGK